MRNHFIWLILRLRYCIKGVTTLFSSLSEREERLLNRLAEEPAIPVSELAEELQVSQVTVRTTLNGLAEKGFLLRTHGGALPAFHPDILERQQSSRPVKEAIARFAASRVTDGESIMIEAGTTTALVARFLMGRRDIKVVTNNLLVLPYARTNPGVSLAVVGGEFRPATESVVGPIASLSLERFHVGTAFLGTDGFSLENGFTTHLVEGAEIVRTMARRAERTVILADSSKYGRTGFAHVLSLGEVSELISDGGLPESARRELREAGIEVTVVE